jgi:formyl-CoA transferase
MSVLGEPESPPVPAHGAIGDLTSAGFLAGAVALALLARERFGFGERVDVSLLAAGMWVVGHDLQTVLSTGQDLQRRARKTAGNPLYNTYRTKDSRWLFFAMLQTDRYWSRLCKAIGREDLEKDPRFDSHEKRCQNSQIIISILDEVLATRTRAEWARVFNQHKLVWDSELMLSEVLSDPQIAENNYVVEFNHPAHGAIKLVGTPFQFSRTPAYPRRHAPQLGEHTEEILLEIGYSYNTMLKLKEEKTIL